MQKKVIKTDLSIIDDLSKKADELDKLRLKAEREIDEDYVQLRTVEREVRQLSQLRENDFKAFLNMIGKIEAQRDEVLKQMQEAEKTFGIKMDKSDINVINGTLKVAQRSEENLRQDVNIYNKAYRALVAAIAKI